MNSVTEKEFLPDNVLPMTRERMKERDRSLAERAKITKTVVRGGARVVKIKLSIPIDQYAGLQRFEGNSDAEKMLMILRMANRRVDEVERKSYEEQQKAQEAAEVEPMDA